MKKIFIMLCILFSISITSHAEVIEVKDISLDEVPAGIEPVILEGAEIDTYLENLEKSFEVGTETKPLIAYINRSTTGTINVDSRTVGVISKVKLLLDYKITSNLPTGRIEYVIPYTTYEGFTMPFEWHQSYIRADITSSGKDVDVRCSGILDAYIFNSDIGGIKVYSYSINLGRYVFLIR